jgi:hypothetical protein
MRLPIDNSICCRVAWSSASIGCARLAAVLILRKHRHALFRVCGGLSRLGLFDGYQDFVAAIKGQREGIVITCDLRFTGNRPTLSQNPLL